MREVDSIHHFEDTPIRAAWDAELEEWFFSILDVVAALTGSTDPKQYIKRVRTRDPELSANWGTICTPVAMIAKDGKKRSIQAANIQGILRIILVSTDAPQDTILSLLNDFKKVNPSGGLVQTLFDFMNNCISSPYNMIDRTRYSKGNIRSMLNKLTSTGDIIAEFILQLSKVIPDLLCKESFLYAPAIEWFMNSVNVDSNMETSQKGWFAIGDGAGLSQGIIHAAATGVIAAHEISLRLEKHTC